MRRRGSIATCAAAVAVATLAFATSAQAAVPGSFFGVDPQRPITAEDYDRMRQAKVDVLRVEAHWAGINPAPGVFNFGTLDDQVRQASLHRIDVLPFIFSTPQWVAQREGHNCAPAKCLRFAPAKRKGLKAYKQFLTQVVGRYGRNGTFWAENPDVPKNPIRIWQIWNEQNSPSFYRPKPNVRKYAKLLDASNDVINRFDRRATVIMGGMFGTPLGGRKPAITAWDFLRKLYNLRGAKRDFDAIAPHPYSANMNQLRAQMKLFIEEIEAARDRKVELWVTEVGWGSGGKQASLNVGRQGQASRLRKTYKLFLNKRKKWNVENVSWYSWRDDPAGAQLGLCTWCPFSGLLEEDYSKKPSYRAYVKFSKRR